MSNHSTPNPNIYLTRDGDKLILREGINPTGLGSVGKRVLIIGGGVTGLTSAWTLLDAGYSVTVVAERWANPENRITSQIAGALWEWPPAVCGSHTDIISLFKSKQWCMTAFRIFDTLQELLPADGESGHGARIRYANFFFDKLLEENPKELYKMNEIIAAEVKGFERDRLLVTKHAVNQSAGVIDAYKHQAPVIDTDQYMGWIRNHVASKGAKLVTERISGSLFAQEEELLSRFEADILINATGLASLELAEDKTVYPLRGGLIRVVNDGTKFPKVTEALVVANDIKKREEDGGIVFIVPRNDNVLILGGLAQPGETTLDLSLESPEVIRMRARCNRFVPGLENAEYDPVAPFVQGLRPFRGSNVRVERDLRTKEDGSYSKIVHSYGQGGAGFSLSFGCANDVLSLVREVEANLPPVPMSIELAAPSCQS